MTEPLTIPGDHCVVHGYHYPKPVRTVKHHIIPLAHGGPDTAENLVDICDTGHYAIHEYLNDSLAGRAWTRTITRADKKLAEQGLAGIRNG